MSTGSPTTPCFHNPCFVRIAIITHTSPKIRRETQHAAPGPSDLFPFCNPSPHWRPLKHKLTVLPNGEMEACPMTGTTFIDFATIRHVPEGPTPPNHDTYAANLPHTSDGNLSQHVKPPESGSQSCCENLCMHCSIPRKNRIVCTAKPARDSMHLCKRRGPPRSPPALANTINKRPSHMPGFCNTKPPMPFHQLPTHHGLHKPKAANRNLCCCA